jgi:hypothetical protein
MTPPHRRPTSSSHQWQHTGHQLYYVETHEPSWSTPLHTRLLIGNSVEKLRLIVWWGVGSSVCHENMFAVVFLFLAVQKLRLWSGLSIS